MRVEELVERYIDAWNRRDLAQLLGLLHGLLLKRVSDRPVNSEKHLRTLLDPARKILPAAQCTKSCSLSFQ